MTSKSRIAILSITLLLIVSSFPGIVTAQDILLLKSGRELKVSISEETETIIKYREYENQAGPLYSIEKSKVESVKYGRKPKSDKTEEAKAEEQAEVSQSQLLSVKKRYILQNGKYLSSRQVKTVMENVPEAAELYDAGRKKCTLSNSCATGIVLTSLVTTIISNKKDDEQRVRIAAAGLVVDAVFIVTAITLVTKGKRQLRRSVEMYNATVQKPAAYRLDFRLSPGSAGICLRF